MLRPARGEATVLGLDTQAESLSVRRSIGYIPSDPSLHGNLSGHDFLTYLANIRRGVEWSKVTALAFTAGCVTGKRSTSVAIVATTAVATYLLNAASGIVSYMAAAKWLSPFFYYNGANPLANGLHPAHTAVLLATITILLGAGYLGFNRRDLRL